jgi:ABC-type transport system involved in multi-copper enzyme maturation permease subunit
VKDVVHSIGYRRLPARPRRWAPWPIARTALALAFRKRSAKVTAALCAFVAFAHAVTLVGQVLIGRLAERMNEGGAGDLVGNVITQAVGQVHETLSTFVGVQLYATAILLAVAAAGLIADDRRTRAFELYFSRPLSGRDYIVGKLLVALVIPVATIVVPFVLLWTLAIGIAPQELADALWPLLGPGLLAAVLATAVLAGTIVGASAIGERSRTVGVAYVLGFIVLSALADGLSESGHRWAGYLGPLRDVQTVSDALLRVLSTSMMSEWLSLRERTNPSAWISAAVLVALTCLGVFALVLRVRKELRR